MTRVQASSGYSAVLEQAGVRCLDSPVRMWQAAADTSAYAPYLVPDPTLRSNTNGLFPVSYISTIPRTRYTSLGTQHPASALF